MKAHVNQILIELLDQADIYALTIDAIVHQTDSNLSLSPALRARTGPVVDAELGRLGRCEVGSAVITSAGSLSAQNLIHAVGPRWGEGSERGKLASVVWECLRLCEDYQRASLAFPAISTGALGYPVENCATTMLSQIIDFTFEPLATLRHVVIVLDNPLALEIFTGEFTAQLRELNQGGDVQVHA